MASSRCGPRMALVAATPEGIGPCVRTRGARDHHPHCAKQAMALPFSSLFVVTALYVHALRHP